MENIVIIPSAVSPKMGVFTPVERMEQTIITIKSVREKIKNAFIVLNDISLTPAPALKKELSGLVDLFIDSDLDPDAYRFSVNGLKSPGELILFRNSLMQVKEKINVENTSRIFKIGARCKLKDSFDLNTHLIDSNQFIFKPLPSWMDINSKLYITRLWSMSPAEINTYVETIPKLMECFTKGFDTEHAHYICFKDKTKEINELHVECKIAPNGSLHED